MKIVKKRFNTFSQIAAPVSLVALLSACFIDPGWIVISIFCAPFLLFLTIWTIKDGTTIEIVEKTLQIKEVERGLSENWKIHVTNVVAYKVVDQNFINSGQNYSVTGKVTGKWFKNAGTKKILVVQTKKRALRLGAKLSEKNVEELFRFLKANLT